VTTDPQGSKADSLAISKVMPVVYDELRRLARHYLRGERAGQSLQPTALVNEAYVRLARERVHAWRNRAHFCAIAAQSMREILVERARARNAAKRGGSRIRVTLDEAIPAPGADDSVDVLALDDMLRKLGDMDAQLVKIVELRFFGGLSIEESAEALGVSASTVKRGWSVAKAWLKRELQKEYRVEG
jgi:RNA polymerase sigma-70 factor, ECF subfamily